MLGVAISRVKDLNHLRVINYRKGICPPPPQPVIQFINDPGDAPSPDLSCCYAVTNVVQQRPQSPVVIAQDDDDDDDDNDDDDNDDDVLLDIDIVAADRPELPAHFPDQGTILKEIRCDVEDTEEQRKINCAISKLSPHRLATFISIVYAKVCIALQSDVLKKQHNSLKRKNR